MYSESETVELKEVFHHEISKEIIAFANTKGGTIYIGIDDTGTIIGISEPDKTILQVENTIRDSIKPDVTMFVEYKTECIDNKNIIVITVQKGTNRPYYLASKGLKPSGVYVRRGTASEPASDTYIRNTIKEVDGDKYEDIRSLEQELSFNTTREVFRKKDIPFDSNNMKTLGIMSIDGIYSNLALLLSDQCNSSIKVSVFSKDDELEFLDRKEFTGSLFKQMEDVFSYIELQNHTKASFNGLYRIDSKSYPEEALREALLNAIVHKDYSYNSSIFISIYSDRIEFKSVGGLPVGIELEDIMLGISVCRNKKLAEVFYRLKLIEAYGTGIPKIKRAYKDYPVKPTFEATNNAFKITLPNMNIESNIDINESKLNQTEAMIINYLKENGKAYRRDIDELLGTSQATSSRVLKKLINEQKIHLSINKGKNTYYYI